MPYIRNGKLHLRANHINVSGIENLYQLGNHVARSVKSKSAPSFSSSEDLSNSSFNLFYRGISRAMNHPHTGQVDTTTLLDILTPPR